MWCKFFKKLWAAIWQFFNPYLSQIQEFDDRLYSAEDRLTAVESAVEDIARRITARD